MTSDLQAALEAAYAQSKQPSLDEEYNRFVQRALEERERLRAERETRVPEPEPEGRKTAAAAASLLRDGKRITVQAAAILLAYYLGLSNAKSNDSNLRYEIKRNTNNMAYRTLEELIFQRAREGRFDLIDPILGTSIAHPQNPDRYWLIEPMAFEVIKSDVVRQPASPTMIIPPIQRDDGEAAASADHETTSAGDQAPLIEAAAPPIDSRNGKAETCALGGKINPENAEAMDHATASQLAETNVTEAPVDLTKLGSTIAEPLQTPSANQRDALTEPQPKCRLLYVADLEKFMARWTDIAVERLSAPGITSEYLANHQKRAQEGSAVPTLPLHRRYIAVQAEKIRRRRLEKAGIAVGQNSK